MNITFDKKTPTEGRLVISLEKPDYQPQVEKKVKEYSKKAAIKGFRPGKVPTSIIQKLYGKSILVEEINTLLSEKMTAYLREANMLVVGDPLPEDASANDIDWANPSDMEFGYRVGLATDFDIDFNKLPAVRMFEITATETDIAQAITDLRDRFSTNAVLETVGDDTDFITGTLTQGEHSAELPAPIARFSKETQEALKGKNKGDIVIVNIENLMEESRFLALGLGKENVDNFGAGEATYTINEITGKTLAELNQEFFDKAVGKDKVSDEAGFRDEIAKVVAENYSREATALHRRDARKMLIDSIKIDLPEDFLKTWLLATNEKLDETIIEKEFDYFTEDLRWTLIRNKVGDTADVKVEREDIDAMAEMMIRSQFGLMGSSIQDEYIDNLVKKFAQEHLKAEKGRNARDIFERVYAEKTMDFVVVNIKSDIQTTDLEGFKAAAKQQ